MKLAEALKQANIVTENGMTTNSTSLNYCVDLFFRAGAMRTASKEDIVSVVSKAFNENPEKTLKLLFWARDVRGGAGERRFFRTAITSLINHNIDPYVHLIPEYGRWDDLLVFENTRLEEKVLMYIAEALSNENGLCAKWMPRKGSFANKLRKTMSCTPKEYRKTLVSLSNVVETNICNNDFDSIEYSKVPSLAMARYGKLFGFKDTIRFTDYINSVNSGSAKINTGAIYPYDVTKSLKHGNVESSEAQWNALPNFLEGNTEMILPLVDVSGSMCTGVGSKNLTALDIAISLGLYISERNEGPFKDHFMTFSANPELQHISGSLMDRFNQMQTADWGMNTDLTKAFTRILDQAIKHKVDESEMPTQILILSDMEFDQMTGDAWGEGVKDWNPTAQEAIEKLYGDAGYKVPNIVYWNLVSRHSNLPVRFDKDGTALISGFSPSILKSILNGDTMTPQSIMNEAIESDRYKIIGEIFNKQ